MINSFSGKHRFLSNFWPCLVELDGQVYPSTEHAYVAAKVTDPELRTLVRECSTAGHVKRLGRKLPLRSDWEEVKLAVMEDLVRQKFTDPELRRLLLETGEQELVEGNHWGDTFWGVCDGVGLNHLGRILMLVRAEIRAAA
jgi:hypothetical protein